MDLKKHFPNEVRLSRATAWLFRASTSRAALRVYSVVLLLLLSSLLMPRFRSAHRARKFQAVLAGLAHVKVDQTTEAELVKLVPYIDRTYSETERHGSVVTWYGVQFSNEFDWPSSWVNEQIWRIAPFDERRAQITGEKLGTWFLSMNAGVKLRDGKVAKVGYSVSTFGGWPRAIGHTLDVESTHGHWRQLHFGYNVSSFADQNLRFQVQSEDANNQGLFKGNVMRVDWTPGAPPEMASHLYRVNLSCVWSLQGCVNARDIAPLLWQDEEKIKAETRARLSSREPCPDFILSDRVRYLPDLDVLLLEVVDSRTAEGGSAGPGSKNSNTEYKLIEVIRGRKRDADQIGGRYWNDALTQSQESMGKGQLPTGSPNPLHLLPGERVLFFTNHLFESCQVVPATPSALATVRTTPGAPRLPEDQILEGLQ